MPLSGWRWVTMLRLADGFIHIARVQQRGGVAGTGLDIVGVGLDGLFEGGQRCGRVVRGRFSPGPGRERPGST